MTTAAHERSWFGHPAGLSTLFFTEMWERLSYYGMRALLILYMVAPEAEGGLGFSTMKAATVYGWYTALVYATGIPGGIIADRWLGHYRAVFVGGIIIALGHFALAVPSLSFFYLGLGLIVVGTGLLKPNISSMVGSLYGPNDPRRDGGFSLFYLGINVGGVLAPLICGTLGQDYGWHWGFGSAGVGMIAGLVQYVLGRRRLAPALRRIAEEKEAEAAKEIAERATAGLTVQEWKRLAVIGVLFLFSCVFFAGFEQAGSSLNLFADRHTDLPELRQGKPIPSTWFQSLNPFFIIVFAPVFSWLWVRLGRHEPSSPLKFVFGLLLLGAGFLLLVPAAGMVHHQEIQVSPMWLVGVYLLHTLGELCLSPVSLSMVTKLAPPKMVGSMMGFWFLSYSVGSKLGGWIASFFERMPLPQLYTSVAMVILASAGILWILVIPLKRLMGGVK